MSLLRALLILLWERGGRICGICSEPLDLEDGQIDHIIAESLGGDDSPSNLQATHRACNIRKGGRNRLPVAEQVRIPHYLFWEDVPAEHRLPGASTPVVEHACRAALRQRVSPGSAYRQCLNRGVGSFRLCFAHWNREPVAANEVA